MAVRGGIGVQDRRGLAASIPAAGIYGRWFYATDTDTWYWDNGTAWVTTPPTTSGMTINNIQRGTISITNGNTAGTATITSVDTTKSLLTFLGMQAGDTNSNTIDMIRVVLTNSTTVTATRQGSAAATAPIVSWEVVEYA